jgi:predicted flap endonuclease-1-like 5' DNA nuclease
MEVKRLNQIFTYAIASFVIAIILVVIILLKMKKNTLQKQDARATLETTDKPISPSIDPQKLVILTNVKGIGPARAEALRKLGILDLAELAEADPKHLAKKIKVSEKMALGWITEAKNIIVDK